MIFRLVRVFAAREIAVPLILNWIYAYCVFLKTKAGFSFESIDSEVFSTNVF